MYWKKLTWDSELTFFYKRLNKIQFSIVIYKKTAEPLRLQ